MLLSETVAGPCIMEACIGVYYTAFRKDDVSARTLHIQVC